MSPGCRVVDTWNQHGTGEGQRGETRHGRGCEVITVRAGELNHGTDLSLDADLESETCEPRWNTCSNGNLLCLRDTRCGIEGPRTGVWSAALLRTRPGVVEERGVPDAVIGATGQGEGHMTGGGHSAGRAPELNAGEDGPITPAVPSHLPDAGEHGRSVIFPPDQGPVGVPGVTWSRRPVPPAWHGRLAHCQHHVTEVTGTEHVQAGRAGQGLRGRS